MGKEYTGCAWHSQQIGIGCQRILLQWILSCIGTFLGVVVLNEGHSPLFVCSIIVAAANQWPVTVVLLNQFTPVTIVSGITYCIAELEVESSTGLASTLNPVFDGIGAVPALADRELRLCVFVIHLGIGGTISFHHVITETSISQVVEQHLQVGLDVLLHVLALMVQVAHAVPSLAGIVVTEGIAVLRSPLLGSAAIIIAADVGRFQFIGHPIVRLLGEVHPVADVLAVIDNHIGDGANAFALEGLNQ